MYTRNGGRVLNIKVPSQIPMAFRGLVDTSRFIDSMNFQEAVPKSCGAGENIGKRDSLEKETR